MEQIITEKNIANVLSNQMADAVERVSSALVLVNGRQGRPASGIVYAQDLILTADHVLEREDDLTIETHDQRTLPAQFVGRDLGTDLAILRVANLGLNPLLNQQMRHELVNLCWEWVDHRRARWQVSAERAVGWVDLDATRSDA